MGRIERQLLDGDAAPTDLRPSPANRTIPHKSDKCFYLRQRTGVLHDLIQEPANGLRRIHIPRTSVNKFVPGRWKTARNVSGGRSTWPRPLTCCRRGRYV